MLNFVTRSSNEADRSRQWCALTRAEHVRFGDAREASLRGGDFGDVRLCLVSMGKHHIVQGPAAHSNQDRPTLKFIFQECGEATIRQGSREFLLAPGQWHVIRKDLPYELDSADQSRQLCITLSSEALGVDAQAWHAWQTPRSYLGGGAQILHASSTASIMCGSNLSEQDCKRLGAQVAQLIGISVRSDTGGAMPDPREAKRRELLDYIDRTLADPDLNVERLAREFGCSVRTIHKLFEDQPTTVVRTIWDKRLERCRSELQDAALASRSITEIAHEWGFSDSQHFSRSFRNKYNSSPRNYRAMHLLD